MRRVRVFNMKPLLRDSDYLSKLLHYAGVYIVQQILFSFIYINSMRKPSLPARQEMHFWVLVFFFFIHVRNVAAYYICKSIRVWINDISNKKDSKIHLSYRIFISLLNMVGLFPFQNATDRIRVVPNRRRCLLRSIYYNLIVSAATVGSSGYKMEGENMLLSIIVRLVLAYCSAMTETNDRPAAH